MKHLKRNSFLLLFVTIIVLYFALKDDYLTIINTIKNMNIYFILIAIILYITSLFLRAIVNYKWVDDKEKVSLLEAFKHMLITQFFNGITPFSTGGQPMEIYMLKGHGLKYTKATNIIMQNFIVYQLALVLFGLFAIIYNQVFQVLSYNSILRNLIIIGFIINTLVAVFTLFVATSEKFTNLLLKIIVSLINKLHFIKDKEKTTTKWSSSLKDFHQYTVDLKDKKSLFVIGIILNIISLAFYYSIPYFLICSLGTPSVSLITCMVASACVMIAAAFIPIPGATGGVEYSFLQIFGSVLSYNVVSAVMIVFRFITYYIGMILGGFLFSFHKRGE